MANKKISELTALTTIASTDLLAVCEDNGDTTFTTKKIVASNLSIVPHDIEVTDATKGIILKNGTTRRRITLESDGTLKISDPL